ncbi:hypothetical protein C8J56DRAFT_152130 [Mycena floridula]|nr:hypothetical protein C8J56DRAFT_152130 [Mycena floridula]
MPFLLHWSVPLVWYDFLSTIVPLWVSLSDYSFPKLPPFSTEAENQKSDRTSIPYPILTMKAAERVRKALCRLVFDFTGGPATKCRRKHRWPLISFLGVV